MMLHAKIRYGLSAAVCLLGPLFSAALGQTPSYLSFHVPGSLATYPLSINDSQTVTGYWVSSSGVTHGFVRQATGVITSFDIAGSTFTLPFSVNNAGQITGNASTGGFVRATDGTIMSIPASYEGTPTQPVKINTSGEIVGNFSEGGDNQHMFTWSPAGEMLTFSLGQGAAYPSVATGLNDSGAIVGYGGDSPLQQSAGFMFPPGGPVQNPETGGTNATYISVSGSIGTFPTGINASGTVVGCYSMNSNAGTLSEATTYYDFVYQPNGSITTLNIPGVVPSCVATNLYPAPGAAPADSFGIVPAAVNINDAGTIVASYTSTANVPSAFVESASGAITTFTVPNGTMTLPTGVNNATDIIGSYAQGTNILGFVQLPSVSCCTGSPVELTVEDGQGFYWDGGGAQYGRTALQVYHDYPSAGQNWTWQPVPGGFTICTLSTVCLSDNGRQIALSAHADVFIITNTSAVLDLNTGEYIETASAPGNGVYLSTGPTASPWNFSASLH